MNDKPNFLNHLNLKEVEGRDRGMRKWRPFASMPEQYYGLNEVFGNLTKVEKPLISAEQYEEINQKLKEALHTRKEVSLTYYKDGNVFTENGIINFVDVAGDKLFYTDEVFEIKNALTLRNLLDVQF